MALNEVQTMIKTWREREFEANGYVAVSPASNVIHMKAEIDELRQAIEQANGMVLVTDGDANNYCQILTVLGMEEEGDPVAEVQRMKTVIEQAEKQEPAGVVIGFDDDTGAAIVDHACEPVSQLEIGMALYTHQPTAPAQPLTEQRIHKIWRSLAEGEGLDEFARAIEAAHGIKGASL
jgi:hypothetical protein